MMTHKKKLLEEEMASEQNQQTYSAQSSLLKLMIAIKKSYINKNFQIICKLKVILKYK